MIKLKDIKWLHLEITTRCNAWCSGCMRNKNGFELVDGFKETDLSLNHLAQILDLMPNLTTVQYCGTSGDCISAKNFIESIDLLLSRKNIKHIQIHTNGSLKTIEWWENLTNKIKHLQHEIIFAIDGLEDTHSIYRQNTNFEKIINNATAVINSGGVAHWQFIPFKHNQHQIVDVIKLSKKLGFKKIEFVKNVRYPTESYHYKSGEKIEILPWDKIENLSKWKNVAFDEIKSENNFVKPQDCIHFSVPSAFVGVDGVIKNCCHYGNMDIEYFDIDEKFEKNNWSETCLKICGSVKN